MNKKVPLKKGFNDTSGIDIESSCEINFLAKEDVWLGAGTVSLQEPQEISMVKRDLANFTVINRCNGFYSVGKFVTARMESAHSTDFSILESECGEYDTSKSLHLLV